MNTQQYIRKVTWIGLAVNLMLAGFKFVAGIIGTSQTLIADAIHSLSDSTTDMAVIVGSYYWSKPADEDHPYGHQRLETLVTIFIGCVLFAAATGIVWKAITTLHAQHDTIPGKIALVAAAVSIVTKEIIYRWTLAAGKRVKSSALTANAWHHRTDAISSIPALAAVGGAILLPTWMFLDHVGAVAVSIFIFQAAFKIIWPGLREMMETGASRETCKKIERIAHTNPAVLKVHGIRSRFIGNNLQVDMQVLVDGSISVVAGHDIAEDVKARILAEGLGVLDVVIHIEPFAAARSLSEDGDQL